MVGVRHKRRQQCLHLRRTMWASGSPTTVDGMSAEREAAAL